MRVLRVTPWLVKTAARNTAGAVAGAGAAVGRTGGVRRAPRRVGAAPPVASSGVGVRLTGPPVKRPIRPDEYVPGVCRASGRPPGPRRSDLMNRSAYPTAVPPAPRARAVRIAVALTAGATLT